MGVIIQLSPEKVIKVCTAAKEWEKARWAKYRVDTIKSIADGLRNKAAKSFWRKLFGAPKKGYDCDQEAIAEFDSKSIHNQYYWKLFHHKADLDELNVFISAAKNNDHQLMKFTGGDAGIILGWLDKDLTIPG